MSTKSIKYKSQPLDFMIYKDGENGASGQQGRSIISSTRYYALYKPVTGQEEVDIPNTPTAAPDYLKTHDSFDGSGATGSITWSKSPPAYTDADKAARKQYYESVITIYDREDEYGKDYVWSTPVKQTILDVDFIKSIAVTTEQLYALDAKIEAIDSKNIRVTDKSENIIFKADGREKDENENIIDDDNRVQIGGFKINKNRFEAGTGNNYIKLSSEYNLQPEILQDEYSDVSNFFYDGSTTITDPETSEVVYCHKFESENYGIANSYAVAKIIFRKPHDRVKIYIESDAESRHDYMMASSLNAMDFPNTADGASYHTSGNQKQIIACKYFNVSAGDYVYVAFRKDSSVNSGLDCGWFYVLDEAVERIQLGNNFKVDSEGSLFAALGKIGGFDIDSSSLSKNSTIIVQDENSSGSTTTSTINRLVSLTPSSLSFSTTKQNSDKTDTSSSLIISPTEGLKLNFTDNTVGNTNTVFQLQPNGTVGITEGLIDSGNIGFLSFDEEKLSADSLKLENNKISIGQQNNLLLFVDDQSNSNILSADKLYLGYSSLGIGTSLSSGLTIGPADKTTYNYQIGLRVKKQSDRDKFKIECYACTGSNYNSSYTLKTDRTVTVYCRYQERYTFKADVYVTKKVTMTISSGKYYATRTLDLGDYASGKSDAAFTLTKDYGDVIWNTADCIWIDGGNNAQQGYIKTNTSSTTAYFNYSERAGNSGIVELVGNILPNKSPREARNGFDYTGTPSLKVNATYGCDLGSTDKPFRNIYCTNIHIATDVTTTGYVFTNAACFDAGTKIVLSNGTVKSIEEIQEGELVKSFNTLTNKVEVSKVLSARKHDKSNELVKLTFEDQTEIYTTMNHPFYTTSGWVSLTPWASYTNYEDLKNVLFELMKEGQEFYKLKSDNTTELVKLKRIQYRHGIDKDHVVYNLDVDGANTFFVNNFLVHNK